MNTLIWGTGLGAMQWYNSNQTDNIIGFCENDKIKWGQTYMGKKIFSPYEIQNLDFDRIVVSSDIYFTDIKNQLISELNISAHKIVSRWDDLKEKMINKYRTSNDEQIQETIAYWENGNELTVFNQFSVKNETYSEVYFDKDADMSYILFEGKKMYFPEKYHFVIRDGVRYVKNILGEQTSNSPHLYIKDQANIKTNSIIVDAGACEGNFALRYVDKAAKIYLVEMDPDWIKALKCTFKEYSQKVVICEKMLSKEDDLNAITLNSLVQEEKIDYLKMDIEGAEIDALLGADQLLKNSMAQCSICSYHNKNDEKYIRFILESYGYQTDTSNGYMIFIHDPYILEKADFRKGVVYASKKLESGD